MRRVYPASRLSGSVLVPADKSISHRYAIIGSMAQGTTRISNFSPSHDCRSTLTCVQELGVRVQHNEAATIVESPGWQDLRQPAGRLDAGNSGTTIRLLSGLLASRPFCTTIAGDASLNQRPMKRVMNPLRMMGASIEARDGEFPPLKITGTRLSSIRYPLPVASAQVKSCVLLAGLTAEGITTIVENQATRDHTERALPVFGVTVEKSGQDISVGGPARLLPADVQVPGDFSAAVYFILAALLIPGSMVQIPGVGLNPTRSALLKLLVESGGDIRVHNRSERDNEPRGDLEVHYSPDILDSFPDELSGALIPNIIDEIPALAVFGVKLKKGLTVRGAEELRKKESDRIHSVVSNLRRIKIDVEELTDGFRIPPGQRISGGPITTFADHRIAMAFGIAGLLAENPVEIDDAACAAISFPDFFSKLELIAGS
ncbi:MAG: 3-phosphoshikimate 1-carboxyvinyltransferase [Acidobacteria bacterium]|nr:MAG: 3-phosphoshikimate 1-carboxyvinyltransferase [Acidobacteriota bacterium]